MTIKRLKGISISNDEIYARTKLADKLPLETPLAVTYYPIGACNLRCKFCGYSSSKNDYNVQFGNILDFDIFKKSVDDLKDFPDKLKAIHFAGFGEPLLHKNLAEMIKYTVDANVAENIDIVTNGTLFSENLSKDIINSGIDWIRISVNGLSSEDYKDNCDANINFEKFVNNIKYLYNNRINTKIYIKILDYMVVSEERKELFYKIFEPICDTIAIENYSEWAEDTKMDILDSITTLAIRGTEKWQAKVCPLPFYQMHILPDGSIAPCCEPRFSINLGNIKETSIPNLWNSKRFNNFRLKMTNGKNNSGKICNICKLIDNLSFPEDNLDNDIEKLKQIYSNI